MIRAVAILLACQLAGELAARGTGLPVPGPVVGAVLLLLWLAWRGGPDADLDRVADTLLGNMSLLFIPAGTGILLHFDRIAGEWTAILPALLVSTIATVAAAGLAFRAFGGPAKDSDDETDPAP